MRPRALWFVAGSAVGVYASAKARRAAYRMSMPGLIDQAAALGHGWRAFTEEVRDGMTTAEQQLARRLAEADPHPPHPASLEATPDDLPELTDERDHP